MKLHWRIAQSSITSNLVVLFASSLGALLTFGFSPIHSLQMIMAAAVMMVIGGSLWLSISTFQNICLAETLGAGLAIGTALLAIFNLVTRSVNLWLVVVLLLLFIVITTFQQSRKSFQKIQPLRDIDIALLGAVPLIAVLPFNIKPLPAVVAILTLVSVSPIRSRLANAKPLHLAVTFALPGALMALAYSLWNIQPAWTDIVGLDVIFDESLAFSVTEIGLSSSPTLLGEQVNGHFVAHATLGAIADLIQIAPFGLLGMGGYALSVIGVALLAFSISKRLSGHRTVAWISISFVFFQSTVSFPVLFVPALRAVNAVALLWFIFAINALLRVADKQVKYSFVVVGLAGSFVTLGKFQWGLVLLGYMAAIPLISVLKKKSFRPQLAMATVTIILSGILFVLFLRGPDGESMVLGINRGLLAGGTLILLIRLVLFGVFAKGSLTVERQALTLVAIGSVATWVAVGGVYRTDYFTHALAILVAVVMVPGVFSGSAFTTKITTESPGLLFLAGALGAFIALIQLIVVGYWRYQPTIPLGILDRRGAAEILLLGAFIATAIVAVWLKTGKEGVPPVLVIFMIATSMSIGIFSTQVLKPVVHGILFSVNDFSSYLITPDQTAVGEWIQMNTRSSDLVATNSLCPVELSIGMLVPDNDPENRCNSRNRNAWISALGHRQMLIEAPFFGPLAITKVTNPNHVSRYNSSVNYGATRDEPARMSLIGSGVRWFVVDLELSNLDDWITQNDIAFINNSYAVVDLAISR
jgi:hypothetical protein